MEALNEAVESRRVDVIGASNFTVEQMRTSEEISTRRNLARLSLLQPVYNLVAREIEAEILPWCLARRIEVMTYSPLAAGFLTGKYAPGAPLPPATRFDIKPAHQDVYFSPRNFAIVEQLRQFSAAVGVPMSRLAMGWALHDSSISTVLVGARTREHIDNALTAAEHPLPGDWIATMNGWVGTAPAHPTPQRFSGDRL
jgi:aryl-alcohol dehydrogenase-like predicted oxidoreductase